MLVLKHNDRVYIGTPSYECYCPIDKKTGKVVPDNIMIWHPKKRAETLVASCDDRCIGNAIRYESIFPNEFGRKEIALDIYPTIRHIAGFFGVERKKPVPATFVFAQNDRAVALDENGATYEIESVFSPRDTINEMAIAIKEINGADNPYKFFKDVYSMALDYHELSFFPIFVFDTKSNRIKVINEEDKL